MMKNATKAMVLRTVRQVSRWEPGRRAAVLGGWAAGGFALAAASVERSFPPLALGTLTLVTGFLGARVADLLEVGAPW